MSSSTMATVVMISAALVGACTLAGIVTYTIQNDSGHTGVNPYSAMVVFVPVTVTGLVHVLALRRRQTWKWPGTMALAVGLAGVALLIYLDTSNTLLQYEVWLHRGMP